jgi:hypothetical protein
MPSGGDSGVDTVYNDRMATIAEQQQSMAQQMFNYWETGSMTPTAATPTTGTAAPAITPAGPDGGSKDVAVGDSAGWLTPAQKASLTNAVANPAVAGAATPAGTTAAPGTISQMELANLETAANYGLVPQQAGLESSEIAAAQEIMPGATSLTKAQNAAALELLPGQTSLTAAQIAEAQKRVGEKSPVATAFYNQALTGEDPNQKAVEARSDVSQAYSSANAELLRNAARYGINPNSGSFQALLNKNAMSKAASLSGATTLAKDTALNTNFSRLTAAMGA